MSAHTPMVVAAARVLCQRGSEQCNVDSDDSWKVYGDDYLADAQAALDAAGVPDLLSCLQEAVEDSEEVLASRLATFGENYRPARLKAMREQITKARAAIASATGVATS